MIAVNLMKKSLISTKPFSGGSSNVANTFQYPHPIMSVSLQKLTNQPSLRTRVAVAWTNHTVMQKADNQSNKLYRNAQTRVKM